MRKKNSGDQKLTIGMDLGDKYCHFCVLDENGEILEEGRITTRNEALRKRFDAFEKSRVALEAGTHSPWISRLLQECGHEVLVAHASKLRMISQNDSKCDKVDAEMLARIARMDPKLLYPIQHRSKQNQMDINLLRSRDALVRTRTSLVNHVRGVVKTAGGRIPKCYAAGFHDKAAEHLPEELREILAPVLE